jgi:peptidoglycan/LPS O-acetylase OafA/YrhL
MIAILVVTTLVNKFLPNYSATIMFLIIFPVTLILSIGLAKISFKYFESYFLKLKNKFSIITK